MSVLHDPNTESLVQDVVSFNTIYCDQSFAAVDNIFTLKFSEQVLVNRIRVSGLQLSAFADKIVSKNSKICFLQFLVNTSDNVVFAIPNRTAHFLHPHNCCRKQSQSILQAHQCVWLSLNTFQLLLILAKLNSSVQ